MSGFLAAAEMWHVQCPTDGVPLAKCSKALDQRQRSSFHWVGCSFNVDVGRP